MDAIGLDGEKLDIVLMQLVRLMKDGGRGVMPSTARFLRMLQILAWAYWT